MSESIQTACLSSASRRRWLGGAAGLCLLGGWQSPVFAEPRVLPGYASWKDASALEEHSHLALETRRSAMGSSVITPASQLFVRSHLPPPEARILSDRDAWVLQTAGLKQARDITLGELRELGLETVATVLQSAGNGRAFIPGKVNGLPWGVGAAGCVVWSGVPLRRVVRALGGLDPAARFITATGAEVLPEGVDPLSLLPERSVPLRALDDALLAWEMNGEPLPLAHGGPLRLIVPGYYAENQIKYIRRLAFTEQESAARMMARDYRLTPVGAEPGPGDAPLWEMDLKSWINSPAPGGRALKPGPVRVLGVAFGGTRAVRQVEVSVDGGQRWGVAQFSGPDLGRFAWRQFVFETELRTGSHVLACRVTDVEGREQPRLRTDNAGGFANNSWLDHAIKVKVG